MTVYPEIHLKKLTGPETKIDWFEVVEPCSCPAGETIPAGFVTDFASVPRLFWSVMPPHCLMATASVRHDYRYDNRVGEKELGPKRARLLTDSYFLADLVSSGVPGWQAALMYAIVRAFGRKNWRD